MGLSEKEARELLGGVESNQLSPHRLLGGIGALASTPGYVATAAAWLLLIGVPVILTWPSIAKAAPE